MVLVHLSMVRLDVLTVTEREKNVVLNLYLGPWTRFDPSGPLDTENRSRTTRGRAGAAGFHGPAAEIKAKIKFVDEEEKCTVTFQAIENYTWRFLYLSCKACNVSGVKSK